MFSLRKSAFQSAIAVSCAGLPTYSLSILRVLIIRSWLKRDALPKLELEVIPDWFWQRKLFLRSRPWDLGLCWGEWDAANMMTGRDFLGHGREKTLFQDTILLVDCIEKCRHFDSTSTCARILLVSTGCSAIGCLWGKDSISQSCICWLATEKVQRYVTSSHVVG